MSSVLNGHWSTKPQHQNNKKLKKTSVKKETENTGRL